MTNPAPRPALRKAPDANVHPASSDAVTRPTLKSAVDETAVVVHRNATQIDLRNPRSTDVSDGLIVTSDLAVNPDGSDTDGPETMGKKSKKSNKGSNKTKSSSKKKDDKKKKKDGKGKEKKGKGAQLGARTNMRISLATEVPVPLRRALRTGTKARGTSVEDRVDSLVTSLRES